jgi:hypothetical protein
MPRDFKVNDLPSRAKNSDQKEENYSFIVLILSYIEFSFSTHKLFLSLSNPLYIRVKFIPFIISISLKNKFRLPDLIEILISLSAIFISEKKNIPEVEKEKREKEIHNLEI